MNAKDQTRQKPDLGENLKRLRKERGWSLLQLAKESGLPQSTLSKVEAGQMSLNYDKLLHVAEVFDVDVRSLFASASEIAIANGTMARRTFDRHGGGQSLTQDHYEARYLSTELKNRLMFPILFEVGDAQSQQSEKGGGAIPLMDIAGERFAFVVKGPVDFHCEQYETVTLQTGDSLYVDAAMPHAFVAPPGKKATVLTVLTSSDVDYLRLAREASARGDTDATNRFRAQKKKKRQ